MEKNYFITSKCPHCKKKMDEVETSATSCPYCFEEIDSFDVWMTKKDTDCIPFPSWITSSWKPLALILFGVIFSACTYIASDGREVWVALGILALGIGWFTVNLFSTDPYAEE